MPSWLACTISTGIMELRHTPLRLKMVAKNSCTLPKPFKGMYITSMPTSMTVVNDDGQVMTVTMLMVIGFSLGAERCDSGGSDGYENGYI